MKKIVIIGIVIVFAIFIFALVAFKFHASKQAIPVRVEQVGRMDLESSVTGFGRVQPTREVDISAKVTGEIVKLYVQEGDTVQRGDTLLQVDRSKYAAMLEQAKANLRSSNSLVIQAEANLKQSRDNLERLRELYGKEFISDQQFEDGQTQVEILEAQLQSAKDGVLRAKGAVDEAQEAYDETIIKAPQGGIVTGLSAEEGEYVIVGTMNIPGSVIMSISQLNEMEAEIEVDETDVVKVETGQEARLEIDAFPDTLFRGTVIQISNKARISGSSTQGVVASFDVKLSIEDYVPGLRPGMSISADIITQRRDSVIAVPIQAVVPEIKESRIADKSTDSDSTEDRLSDEPGGQKMKDRREIVFILKENIARAQPVRTGISDDRYIEILEGLEGDETIVVGSYKVLRELRDGDKVKVSKPGWENYRNESPDRTE
ncbi:efflux RND transporter periplasmic adaptor subunit [bacterium]|nr:efflux RND transporter periplasmic adaptor subunit [bacterium]